METMIKLSETELDAVTGGAEDAVTGGAELDSLTFSITASGITDATVTSTLDIVTTPNSASLSGVFTSSST